MPEGDKTIVNRPRRPAMFITYNKRARRPKEYKYQGHAGPLSYSDFHGIIIVGVRRVGRRNDHAIHDLVCVTDTLSDQARV